MICNQWKLRLERKFEEMGIRKAGKLVGEAESGDGENERKGSVGRKPRRNSEREEG